MARAKAVTEGKSWDGRRWNGTPKGSLDPRLTDLYAGKIRAYIPVGFRGLATRKKDSRQVHCLPFGTQVPPERFGQLRALEVDEIDELLDLFRELGRTLPIFRPDPGRFQSQNSLLAVHRVGYNLSEGVFVLA